MAYLAQRFFAKGGGARNWRDFSVVHKLGLLLALNAIVAVALIAAVFSVGSVITRYHTTQEQMQVLAKVIGENSRAALAFGDHQSAKTILSSLGSNEVIDYVHLLDGNGAMFAEAELFDDDSHNSTILEKLVYAVFPSHLGASYSITDQGQVIGRIEVTAHLLHVWTDLLTSQAVMALVALLCAALTVHLGMRMSHVMTDPILGLAGVSARVSREQDYSLRAVKAHNDEVGLLVDDFNHMLAEIQARDEALEAERVSLHQRTVDMRLARDEAERASRVKSEFISTVSHELRTPLTAISGALGLIVGGAVGGLPLQVREMLNIAHKNSRRLSFLINDLLDMEKLLAGKLHFDLRGQALMPLLEQTLADNQSYAAQFQVTFLMRQRADGVQVNVDAQRLQQVMANLLSNAAKFSPHGETVEIDACMNGNLVRVEVSDHGPGIPQEFQSRIFQKFSQADASDTRKKGGTGLGLAISRELTERMGGRMGFLSQPGQGARFFFELPVWNEPFSQPMPLLPQALAHSTDSPRILMVEDDPDIARVLSRMLTRAGYLVDAAASGAEALQRARQTRYIAITLDLQLPDISGQQLIHQLRGESNTASTPIIVISARMEEGREKLGTALPGIDWLAKPLDQTRLLGALERLAFASRAPHARVLHVEDDVQMHEVVRALAGDHFDFELVTSLREARARVALERFDAVILDLTLPNESGWDLLPELHAKQPDTRVVVLTGGDLSEVDRHRVDAVLKKGHVSPRELVDAIGGPEYRESDDIP